MYEQYTQYDLTLTLELSEECRPGEIEETVEWMLEMNGAVESVASCVAENTDSEK